MSGTPLARVKFFLPVLERPGLTIGDASHLGQYVPKLEANEFDLIKKELNGCERVFSLLKVMYGENQDSVLADHMQTSLMLRFNKRSVQQVP